LKDPRLKIISIERLPPRWLGKNFALKTGRESAKGELLLFTDADVLFKKSALKLAVTYMINHQIDHLAAVPKVDLPSLGLKVTVPIFGAFFLALTRPWRARRPGSRFSIGIGAFNLLR